MSKGSRRRPEDTKAYRENFDRVFGTPFTQECLENIAKARDIINAQPVPTEGRINLSEEYSGPSCRDPKNCSGSCVRDPACNE